MRCPDAKILGTAIIKDYELLFKGSKTGSYLTIEKKKGSEVPVAVWAVTKADEAALDLYEGYPTFYYKKKMPITYKGIKSSKEYSVDAFVYIMHEERLLGMPTKGYVSTCMKGYETFGFSPVYLVEAVMRSEVINA